MTPELAGVAAAEIGDWTSDDETGGLVQILVANESVQAGLWKPGPVARSGIELVLAAHEALYVLEGSGRISVDGGAEIELRPGVMVSLPRGARTTWIVDDDFKEFWVYALR